MDTKGFFLFEIITNIFVSSFRFIRISMGLAATAIRNRFTLTVRGSTLDVRI